MDNHAFVYVGYIATTPEKLWNALTQSEFTQQYWYGRRIESEWKVGAPVRAYEGDSDSPVDYGEVLVWDPYHQMVYTFQNKEEINIPHEPTHLNFTLEEYKNEGVVKLTLVHDHLPSPEIVNIFNGGWAPVLSSLKTLLETGKPLPRLNPSGAKAPIEA